MNLQSPIFLMALSSLLYFGKSVYCPDTMPNRCGATWPHANLNCNQCCLSRDDCINPNYNCYRGVSPTPCAGAEPTQLPTLSPIPTTSAPTETTPAPSDTTPSPTDTTPPPTSVTQPPTDATPAPTSITQPPSRLTAAPSRMTSAPTNPSASPTKVPSSSPIASTPSPTPSTPAPSAATPPPTSATPPPTSATPPPSQAPSASPTASPSTSPTASPSASPSASPTEATATTATNDRIRSPIPPSDLDIADIPMFLTITIDDALHEEAHTKTQQIMYHVNRNNQQIPLVYYISNEYSDYSKIQHQYLLGCEIATHTVTHTTNVATDITKWYHEIVTSRELIATHADIPIDEIVGFRAPFLQQSDNMFKVLHGVDPPYLYDSSSSGRLGDDDLFDWPYTRDNYEPDMIYDVGEGPQESYPGLWEMPMYYLYSDIANKQYFNIMDYTGDYALLLASFKASFLHRYNTNRAPMGLYFHASWFYTAEHVDALNDFIAWVLLLDDTWIVTNKEVIKWINNPVSNAQYSFENQNGLTNGKTDFLFCSYLEGIFATVLEQCPETNPHLLSWDASQLITTDILITTDPDNILTTATDICENDDYAIYDSTLIYCDGTNEVTVVRYDDAVYECQWWTMANTPGTSGAWLLQQDCIVLSESFVKGSISPYGTTAHVFLGGELQIDIEAFVGYTLDPISVTVDNVEYDLTIFDDYQLIGSESLIIRFSEITEPEYQIEISFT